MSESSSGTAGEEVGRTDWASEEAEGLPEEEEEEYGDLLKERAVALFTLRMAWWTFLLVEEGAGVLESSKTSAVAAATAFNPEVDGALLSVCSICGTAGGRSEADAAPPPLLSFCITASAQRLWGENSYILWGAFTGGNSEGSLRVVLLIAVEVIALLKLVPWLEELGPELDTEVEELVEVDDDVVVEVGTVVLVEPPFWIRVHPTNSGPVREKQINQCISLISQLYDI